MFIQGQDCLCTCGYAQHRGLPEQEAFCLGSFVFIPSMQTLTPSYCQHEQAKYSRKMCISDFFHVSSTFQSLRLLTTRTVDGSHTAGLALARNGQCLCINNKTEAGEGRKPSLFFSQMLGSTHIRGKIILPSCQHWIRNEEVKADGRHRKAEFIH